MSSFYSLSATLGNGETINMSNLEGATRREYAQFESLHNRWGSEKLAILAFPSREFGSQEFAQDEEIAQFAAGKNFKGLLMKLGSVKGASAPE
eukprot:6601284-Ditylum_brightwellii.AAC.1